MTNLKRVLIVFFLIILVLATVFVLKTYNSEDQFYVMGTIQRIDGNTLSVYGNVGRSADIKNLTIIDISVPENVRILKTIALNEKSSGLGGEVKQVDLSVLRRDYQIFPLGIEVKLKTGFMLVLGREAEEIRYVFPKI